MRILVEAVLAHAQKLHGWRHDLLGRIFHRVLHTARYDGSYYTATSSAVLLSSLALRPDDLPADLSDFHIVDPACGTGTLLMAVAERIRDLRAQDDADGGQDSRTLIEDVLFGYDVNLTATHMAATTLGLLSPTTQFRKMNLHRLRLGTDQDGAAHLGSLEFLTPPETDKGSCVVWLGLPCNR